MIQLMVTVLFAWYSVKHVRRIISNRSVASEFGVSGMSLVFAVLATSLVWVPLLGTLAPQLLPGILYDPAPLVLLLFIPHILIYRPLIRKLETSGTSRVEELEAALRDARILGYLALIYVVLVWGLNLFVVYQLSNR